MSLHPRIPYGPPEISYDHLEHIKCEARDRALQELYTKMYKEYYLYTGECGVAETDDMVAEVKDAKRHSHLWVTLNPKPFTTIEELNAFIDAVHKIPNRKWCASATYAFESRSTNPSEAKSNIPPGFHCHMVIKRGVMTNPSAIRNGLLAGRFKNMFGHKLHIHIMPITKSEAEQKVAYITVKEKDHFDAQMRTSHNLDAVYEI